MLEKINTPEWDRYRMLQGEWSAIKEFLVSAERNDVVLAEYAANGVRGLSINLTKYQGDIEKLLAAVYDIDLEQVEKEKNDVLEAYLKSARTKEAKDQYWPSLANTSE